MKAILRIVLVMALLAIIGYLIWLANDVVILDSYFRPLPMLPTVGLFALVGIFIFILVWRSRRKGGPPTTL